jgi:hypothetical protein
VRNSGERNPFETHQPYRRADHPGFEPGTLELTALCSAVELMVINGKLKSLGEANSPWSLLVSKILAVTLTQPKPLSGLSQPNLVPPRRLRGLVDVGRVELPS